MAEENLVNGEKRKHAMMSTQGRCVELQQGG